MSRIRTIKPEFPQSETIGKLSRDARLLFIQLWTIADDEGRARAASRMLASLLYPYDDDAPKLIEGWLDELERNHCIHRYVDDGDTYLEIIKWLKHQKIDHPSKSKYPNPREPSRKLAPDRTKDRTLKKERSARANAPIADDYSPNETTRRVNAEHGFSDDDLRESTAKMVAWAKSKGEARADWNASHQNWIRNNAEKRGERNVQAGKSVHAAVARLDDFAHGRTRNPFDHASGDAAGSTPPRLLSQG